MEYGIKHAAMIALLLVALAAYSITKTPGGVHKRDNQQNLSNIEFTSEDCQRVFAFNPFSLAATSTPTWSDMLLDLTSLEANHTWQQEMDVYARILAYINKTLEYQDDIENTWKTPHQLLRDGGGDCEDFTTAFIYYAMKAGIDRSKFRINFALVDCNGAEGYHYYPEVKIQNNGEEVWLPVEVTKNKATNSIKSTDPLYYLDHTYPARKRLCWMNETEIVLVEGDE